MRTQRTIDPARLNDDGVLFRFWSKVRIADPSDCWVFTGATSDFGHGKFGIDGVVHFAHRVAWALHSGCNIPAGMYVLHRCDNPPCVNPFHLFLGSMGDNMRDMWSKGRHIKAQWGHMDNTKLTEADVLEIRRLHETGLTQQVIADQFSVSQTNVGQIVRRQSWKHV